MGRSRVDEKATLDVLGTRWIDESIVLEALRTRGIKENTIVEVPRTRWIDENSVLEVARRRWIDENSILEVPRTRWIDENSVLEVTRTRWIDENSVLGSRGPSPGGAGIIKIILLASPPRVTGPWGVASRRWTDENSVLEDLGTRWIDDYSTFGPRGPSPGGPGIIKIVLLASPPRVTGPSRVASNSYPRPPREYIF